MCAAARAIKLDCRTRIDVNRTRPSTVAMDWVTVSIISVFRNQQSMVTRRPVSQPGKAVGVHGQSTQEKSKEKTMANGRWKDPVCKHVWKTCC